MNKYAIIVAGGTGQRMNSEVPKQLLTVHNKEIVIHTLEKFLSYDPAMKVVLVVHPILEPAMKALLAIYKLEQQVRLVLGGDTRFQSVKNGLGAITDPDGMVGIHDAARPMVSVATIDRCYTTAAEKGNAIPVVALSESLREVSDEGSKAVSRDRYRLVQTPQCFQLGPIRKAFEQDYSPAFTDDATVLESAGGHIHLVEGNVENIKITHPADLQIAAIFLT